MRTARLGAALARPGAGVALKQKQNRWQRERRDGGARGVTSRAPALPHSAEAASAVVSGAGLGERGLRGEACAAQRKRGVGCHCGVRRRPLEGVGGDRIRPARLAQALRRLQGQGRWGLPAEGCRLRLRGL